MSENPSKDTAVHPADALGVALDRANSLLLVLMDLYETRREEFAAGNPFIVHGMSAVSDLLEEARVALAALNENYDMSLIAAKPETATTNIVELAAKSAETPSAVTAGAAMPKPHLKPIAAAVVTLKDADEGVDKMIKSFRQL